MAQTQLEIESAPVRGQDNAKPSTADRAVHDWYRFVLSFPPHLVRTYLERFGIDSDQRVLDPFCGTGTTLVECKKLGIPSVGIDFNPMVCFASRVKTDWAVGPNVLLQHAHQVAERTSHILGRDGLGDLDDLPLFRSARKSGPRLLTLPAEAQSLLLKGSISPLPMHKALVLLRALQDSNGAHVGAHERLALAKSVVLEASNLHFGPEVGVGTPKKDAPVVASWLRNVQTMAGDLREVCLAAQTPSTVHQGDSRVINDVLGPRSVDAVITSPPYPNEKDYTRTTRLESVLLGFLKGKDELRRLKQGCVRSNTRSVYKADRDDELVAQHREIQRIAAAIEKRRIELGKTSGFERLYARVTKLYFGGMARHLAELRTVLRPGASLAYVVGDQASYLRVMIRTGQILAGIADSLGYDVVGIELFRTRHATATGAKLREEVVVLRWPRRKKGAR